MDTLATRQDSWVTRATQVVLSHVGRCVSSSQGLGSPDLYQVDERGPAVPEELERRAEESRLRLDKNPLVIISI